MNINITVANKVATVQDAPVIICGNSDYNIIFSFDAEWRAYEVKTARFIYVSGGELQSVDVVFEGNTAAVPVLSGVTEVYIGAYAGNLRTTTPARVACKNSILCSDPVHIEPTPDVYNQILELLSASIKEIEDTKKDLQAQIDSIVIGSTADADAAAEVAQSRVDANNKTYYTLQERLNAEQAAVETLTGAVETMGSEVEALTGAVETMGPEVEALTGAVETMGPEVETLKTRVDAVGDAETQIRGEVSGLSKVASVNLYDKKYESIIDGNLIDKSTLSEQMYLTDNGEAAASQTGYYVTDFIPIFGNNIAAETGGSTNLIGACIYDKDFNFIRSYTERIWGYKYTEGDAYFRIMLREEQLNSARAFYGDILKNYTPFDYNVQKDAKDIKDTNARLAANEEKAFLNTQDIDDIKSKFTKVDELVFSAYDTPTNPIASNTFMGFATPYEHHGIITSVAVNGGYRSGEILLEILDETFTTVIASVSKTVATHNGSEKFSFDSEISLDGVYYFSVRAIDTARFAVENVTTPNSKRSETTPNKYMLSSASGVWSPNTTGYDLDIKLYNTDYEIPNQQLKNVIYVGYTDDCQFDNVQSAINSITDDSETNPYIIYVKAGTYEPFTMVYTDNTRTSRFGRVRWISIIGLGCINDVVFFDNRGNYKFSPCEIHTNGVIKNITFIDKTDAEHHTQESNRTFAYAVHSDFGTCRTRYEDCYMYSNAGPAIGIGTWENEALEFYNCRFESDCDGTFGEVGQGAFFCHTATDGNDRKNQVLRVHNCVAIAPLQTNGSRLAVISGYEGGTYSYELQNFGSFGMGGARASLQAPDNDLLSPYSFNNTPANLNYSQT